MIPIVDCHSVSKRSIFTFLLTYHALRQLSHVINRFNGDNLRFKILYAVVLKYEVEIVKAHVEGTMEP